MDSITQATLGAAVGEAVLGKKMGNKAILMGAIAGTIPDLDVLSRLFLDHQIYGLVYHRGITHSIFFTLVASPIFAWLSLKYYERGLHKQLGVQRGLAIFWGVFYSAIFLGVGALAYYTQSLVAISVFVGVALLAWPIYRTLQGAIEKRNEVDYRVTFWEWTIMYVLAFLTHWVIDACTAYGTQIFEPFSNYRIAFNNISIVDPLYTVPMIIGLVGTLYAKRTRDRRLWNGLGLALSTLYMASTFYSKSVVNKVVQQNIEQQKIAAVDYITYPTIFNTLLWQTTIVTEEAYYYGVYSLMDESSEIELLKLPKNHQLVDKYRDNELMKIVLWFAKGYYNISEGKDGELLFNNLRFGLFGLPKEHPLPLEDRYIFRFRLVEKDGELDIVEDRDEDRLAVSEAFGYLWRRMWGKREEG